jgi:hypothetical protein
VYFTLNIFRVIKSRVLKMGGGGSLTPVGGKIVLTGFAHGNLKVTASMLDFNIKRK